MSLINKYCAHFNYTAKHKWYVFIECCKLGIPLRGALHDLSKFMPREFHAYAVFFFDENGNKKPNSPNTSYMAQNDIGLKMAWFWHSKLNKHHWNYWILVDDLNSVVAMEMPEKYVLEMIADWKGAAKAKGTGTAQLWYSQNKDKMVLHPETRSLVEKLLGNIS